MKTLSDVRKALKPLGYKVKTTATTWGRAATYQTLAGKEPGTVFTAETLETWKPLFDWRRSVIAALKVVRNNENVTGLL